MRRVFSPARGAKYPGGAWPLTFEHFRFLHIRRYEFTEKEKIVRYRQASGRKAREAPACPIETSVGARAEIRRRAAHTQSAGKENQRRRRNR
jgi:hypothetical protein